VRLRESANRIRRLLVLHWARLLPGSVGYVAAQVVLLYFSLRSVGLDVPVSTVLMAAGIERLGTLVPITPGGAGVAEIGTIAWLVAAGLDPVEVVAGVLVYRVFLVAMEIPLGGVLLGAWAWLQRTQSGRRLGGLTA
jgi:putative heme transporter